MSILSFNVFSQSKIAQLSDLEVADLINLISFTLCKVLLMNKYFSICNTMKSITIGYFKKVKIYCKAIFIMFFSGIGIFSLCEMFTL